MAPVLLRDSHTDSVLLLDHATCHGTEKFFRKAASIGIRLLKVP
jgi:hypothetical protein